MPEPHLNIVVSYRDRRAHLDQFIRQVSSYFTYDKVDKNISYEVNIIEQADTDLFNLGMLKNIGFLVGEPRSSYTCFHDVDYLPIWADYSPVAKPGRIVWFGAETRPVRENGKGYRVVHNRNDFFGGVLLFPNDTYRAIGGSANRFWGWGYEDADVALRLAAVGIHWDDLENRDGYFNALDHDNRGFVEGVGLNAVAQLNQQIFHDKWALPLAEQAPDGLDQVAFDLIDQTQITLPAEVRPAKWTWSTVRLTAQSTPEHRAAAARDRDPDQG